MEYARSLNPESSLLVLLLVPLASAGNGWFSRTFGPSDHDLDGVPDRTDICPTLAEAPNGYADEDGCPDHLSFVTVQATHAGRPLRYAEYWMQHDGKAYVANGPAMSLEHLVPGEQVEVASRYACLGGEGRVTAGTDPVGVRLQLHPERTSTVTLTVTDSRGTPVDATVRWTGSSPAACGPDARRTPLQNGSATVTLGAGTHTYVVRAKGIRPVEGTFVIEEPGDLTLPIVLSTQGAATSNRLPDKVYFASNKAKLDQDAHAVLDAVAAHLIAHPELGAVTIEGHADQRASDRYNERLAKRRADAVLEALAQRGLDRTRLSTLTRGEADPAAEGWSESANSQNRRVEFLTENAP